MFVLRSLFYLAAVTALVSALPIAVATDDAAVVDSEWAVSGNLPPDVQLAARSVFHDGPDSGLRLRFTSRQDFQQVKLQSQHPPAVPLQEFQATLRFNSNIAGARLGLRLILPRQTDPRTGKPLVTTIPGERYSKPGQWQTLTAGTSASAVDAQMRRIRAELHRSDIDATGAYIHGCVLQIEVSIGDTFLDLGATQYGPLVAPPALVDGDGSPPRDGTSALDVSGLRSGISPDTTAVRASIRLERNQVFLDDSPVFLRMAPDHGESADQLRTLGLNAAWVSDYRDQNRQSELLRSNLIVMATPPHPQFDPTSYDAPLQGLLPLEQACPLVSAFLMGTRVDATQLPHLMAWTREVRSADRILQRPLMADMTTGEGVASREIDLVGIGEHVIGRNRTFGEARNLIYQRHRAASQLTLPWTWLQTEPSSDLATWRESRGLEPLPIEPEQLTMQLIAALSGGCRGDGYWKTRSLTGSQPVSPTVDPASLERAADESRLSIELANLYLQILEPLLVGGRIEGHIPVSIGRPLAARSSASTGDGAWLSPFAASAGMKPVVLDGVPDAPDAAVITSGINSLILAGYWDNSSQFVPDSLFAKRAQLTVAASETASAWRVTATGIASLPRNMTAGGLQLDIPDFDQFAMFFISSDPDQARQLDLRIREVADRAARIQVVLTRRKYERVLRTSAAIDETGRSQPQLQSQIRHAAARLDQADLALDRSEYRAAEQLAIEAARTLRSVQQRYWMAAVRDLSSPTASPHTMAFASLPDHWQMLDRIEQAADDVRSVGPGAERLPSGNFDNLRSIEAAGWSAPILPTRSVYVGTADVLSDRDPSQRFLRMLAWKPAAESARARPQLSLLVMPPAVEVAAGDILEISGRVRLGQKVRPEDAFPLLVFDDELGPESAVRPVLEPSWRTFQMFRQAGRSGQVQFTFVLNGSAEVHLDDVSVRRVAAAASPWPTQAAGYTLPSPAASLPALEKSPPRIRLNPPIAQSPSPGHALR